jgi:2-methylcitrate dehydratase PrpD
MSSRVRHLSEVLGEFVAGFRLEEAPQRDELIERVRWHMLDAIGVAYSSWTADDGYAQRLLRTIYADFGRGTATVIGSDARTSTAGAAFINGALVHGSDFDDIDLRTVMHCEAFAVPATLAVAERERPSGLELAEAFVVGTEVALRMAAAPRSDGGLFAAGFHNTAVFGTFGATAGVAKILRLDAEQTAAALALAVSFASGTSVGWLRASGRNKPPQAGWAAHSGVVAAGLAANGYTCSLDTIDGPRGLFDAVAWTDGWSRDAILDGLGQDWRMARLAIKLYPCGAMIQATAEAVHELVRAHGLEPADVRAGELRVPAQFQPVMDDMGASLYRPTSGFASIGSFPIVAARIILDGHYGLEHLTDEAVREPALLEMADRLAMVSDTEHLELPLDERPATVTLETAKGRFTHAVSLEAGHHSRLTRSRVVEKFRANAGLVLTDGEVAQIEDAVLALERWDDTAALISVLRPCRLAQRAEPDPV